MRFAIILELKKAICYPQKKDAFSGMRRTTGSRMQSSNAARMPATRLLCIPTALLLWIHSHPRMAGMQGSGILDMPTSAFKPRLCILANLGPVQVLTRFAISGQNIIRQDHNFSSAYYKQPVCGELPPVLPTQFLRAYQERSPIVLLSSKVVERFDSVVVESIKHRAIGQKEIQSDVLPITC